MEILFRGFHADENGTEVVVVNGKEYRGKWVYGYYCKATRHWNRYGIHNDWIITSSFQNGGFFNVMGRYAVIAETVGQYTGLDDKNGKKIFVGDKALFLDTKCEVCFERGTFGIGSFTECFDYSLIQKQVKALTGNSYSGIGNDNFVSLWDIYWNFNDEDEAINEIEVIGTVFDKAEK